MSTFQLTDLQHIRLTFSLLGPVRWPGNGGELLLRLSELKSGNCSQKCLHKVLGGEEKGESRTYPIETFYFEMQIQTILTNLLQLLIYSNKHQHIALVTSIWL